MHAAEHGEHPDLPRLVQVSRLRSGGEQGAVSGHEELHRTDPVPSDRPEPVADQLRYLAHFKGSSCEHTESDLRCFLAWCAERGPDPLAARRPHLELYIR